MQVHVRPRSSREEVGGTQDGALQVRVHAPPAGGEANAAVRAVLARALGVRPGAVRILGGPKSRRKRLFIQGDPDRLGARLAALAGSGAAV